MAFTQIGVQGFARYRPLVFDRYANRSKRGAYFALMEDEKGGVGMMREAPCKRLVHRDQ